MDVPALNLLSVNVFRGFTVILINYSHGEARENMFLGEVGTNLLPYTM
jgi:hypothetical protein